MMPEQVSRVAPALGLLLSIFVTFSAAAVGGLASVQAASFYAELIRPAWAPPGWLFGPVWSALYTLMAVSAWLVWRQDPGPGSQRALVWYGVQLLANALWSWLFFYWHLGALAMADVLLLWALILGTCWQFGRIRPLAAWLMLPYLGWVGFASVLTWAIWRANPGLLG